MTLKELEEALTRLSDADFATFVSDFGGSYKTRKEVLRAFVDYPDSERRICQLLGLMTQDERLTEATISSARSARWSMIWAFFGVIVSVVALVIAITI